MNIILCGMPRCGKTTIGTLLAKSLKKEFIDIDEMVCLKYRSKFGKRLSIKEMCLKHGEDFFRLREKEVIKKLARLSCTHCSKTRAAVLQDESEVNDDKLKSDGETGGSFYPVSCEKSGLARVSHKAQDEFEHLFYNLSQEDSLDKVYKPCRQEFSNHLAKQSDQIHCCGCKKSGLVDNRARVIALGGGSLFSDDNKKIICSLGILVFIDLDKRVLVERITKDTPTFFKDGNIVDEFEKWYHRRYSVYKHVSDLHIKIMNEGVDVVVQKIKDELMQKGV